MCRTLSKVTQVQKEGAIKDNDMIYHERVPLLDGMPPIEKVNAVKVVSFENLLANGAADLPKLIGPDLFHKLIPIKAHEASSLYSLEKDKVLRGERDNVDNANGEFEATIASLDFHRTINALKQGISSGSSQSENDIPSELLASIRSFSEGERGNGYIEDMILSIR
jgi:BRO1-like domain